MAQAPVRTAVALAVTVPAPPGPDRPADATQVVLRLREIAERARDEKLTFAHAVERLGPSSFAVIALVLAAPFLQPVPTGPLATVGGLAIAALGLQMMRREPAVRLPAKVGGLSPGRRGWASIHRIVGWTVAACGRLGRARLTHWTAGESGDRRIGFLVLAGGLLIAVPFVALPLNNTLPALGIVSAALARLRGDGRMLLVSAFWMKATLAYFAFVLWGMWALGSQGLAWLRG
jgi:hypothetical protein